MEGGKINARTTEDLVRVMEIDGEEWLFYRGFPINVAFMRGTTADPDGNVTMEREALTLDNLAMAMAAQELRRPRDRAGRADRRAGIAAPAPGARSRASWSIASWWRTPEHHLQTYATVYNPAFAPRSACRWSSVKPMPLDERKIIARRARMELRANAIVNLGIGMPEGVAAVAAEERIIDFITLTAEPGVIGGVPASGLNFGAAVNTEAIIDQNQQFDFYDGGGLDLAFLGMARGGRATATSTSAASARSSPAPAASSTSARTRARWCSPARSRPAGSRSRIEDGRLRIAQEGRAHKFLERVEQITFSGQVRGGAGKPVLYVTERCVFRLRPEGLELIEVAPGIDVERGHPGPHGVPADRQRRAVHGRAHLPPRADGPAGPAAQPRPHRPARLRPRAQHPVPQLRGPARPHGPRTSRRSGRRSRRLCQQIGRRVAVVVNYDAFRLDQEVADAYAEMVRSLEDASTPACPATRRAPSCG